MQVLTAKLGAAASHIAIYLPFLPAAWHSVRSMPLPDPAVAGEAFRQAVNSGVLGAACAASLKLFLVCIGIGWAISEEYLPKQTASVLSKVSFQVLIPCMLFSKVASTLAEAHEWTLFCIPLIAVLQICVGWAASKLAVRLVDGNYSEDKKILGWHPLNPTPGATAIAASMASSVGLPQGAAPMFQARQRPVPRGLIGIVKAACMFGNSMTLPLVFMTSLLVGPPGDRAVGYLALYQLVWSPLLWTLGSRILQSNGDEDDGNRGSRTVSVRRTLPPPRHLWQQLRRGGLAWVLSEAWRALKRGGVALKSGVLEVVNPPLIGVLLGLAVGLTPLGKLLFPPATPTTANFAAPTPDSWGLNIQLAVGAARAAMDLVAMLGGATLAVSSIVLGASMFPADRPAQQPGTMKPIRPPQRVPYDAGPPPSSRVSTKPPSPWDRLSARVQRTLRLGLDPADARALMAVSLVRLLIMPLASIAIVKGLAAVGCMPADPVVTLVVLLQGAMPTAQNLVVLLNLDEDSQGSATRLAELLLRLYALAVVPLTFWVAVFSMQLPAPLPSL